MNTREVSVFLCVLFFIPVCTFVCTAVAREEGSDPGKGYGLCPTAFGTKGLLYYACWLHLWEIRFGPGR